MRRQIESQAPGDIGHSHRRWPAASALAVSVILIVACSTTAPSLSTTPSPTVEAMNAASVTSAMVVSVIDGVTIDARVNEKVLRVRYLGVEVPESNPVGDSPPMHERALQFNRFLVEGRTVDLEKGSVDSDPLGHLLRYVYVDGEMINLTLLTNGYATVASFPSDFENRTSFTVAEEGAKREGRGYWSPPANNDGEGNVPPGPTPAFSGGTLPEASDMGNLNTRCDYTGTSTQVIKGNVEPTGQRLYLVPGDLLYSTTVVSDSDGDMWFCTEDEAVAAGWTKSKH